VWDHAFDGVLYYKLGATGSTGFRRLGFVAADIARVAGISFLKFFFSGEYGFGCVDDDDVITGINMGRECGFVFTAKDNGCFFGYTANDGVAGIDEIPSGVLLFFLCAESFHILKRKIQAGLGQVVKKNIGFVKVFKI
jgi:hypothetical protein